MPSEPVVRTERGPLTGIRVIELGSVVAGPFATRLLADYGADVIKVEAPDRPDPLRTWGQEAYRDHHLWWTVHARNKRCITLDLRSPDGRKPFLELARTADVVVENFRPGTMEKWNLDYPTLSAANKGLVLVRVSGFGQTGPYSKRPGYASVAEAMGGLRAINGYPGQAPPRMAISLGDSLGGLFAALGAVAALQHRSRTGLGQVVDVSLAESCLALTESMIPEFDRLGRVRRPSGTRLDGIAPSNLFKTADGVWVIVAANQDTVFRRLCRAMARPELADDPRFATHVDRGRNQDLVEGIVAEWVAGHDAETVQRLLDDADVVVGPLWTAKEIVSDPHFEAREMLVPHYDERVGENVLGPGVVPKFSASPKSVRWAGPAEPGYHNAEVLREILASTPEGVDQKESQ
ncbi:CaiB/BaiF CoA transferase family protein [Amycolatopsis pithecellobii]|uniref:CoA transferase n=1 Tax=Amycolatopsis pithecellobii TaxID=664692 RepID=A0A6N7YHS6_9PSEU|nr:CoA transferase [Amycolatopsis pithecellobii]MTD52445.1 CoA transferase [Amycolatopsis pithecellobii]